MYESADRSEGEDSTVLGRPWETAYFIALVRVLQAMQMKAKNGNYEYPIALKFLCCAAARGILTTGEVPFYDCDYAAMDRDKTKQFIVEAETIFMIVFPNITNDYDVFNGMEEVIKDVKNINSITKELRSSWRTHEGGKNNDEMIT